MQNSFLRPRGSDGMGIFKSVKVGYHPRRRLNGRVERVRGHHRRKRRLRWRVVTDDLFAGLAVLVESSGGTVMRILTITFAALAVLGYIVIAPIAWMLGHPIGPKQRRTHGFRRDLRRRTRRYKRARIRVVKERLGVQQVGWTAQQRRAQRQRAAKWRRG